MQNKVNKPKRLSSQKVIREKRWSERERREIGMRDGRPTVCWTQKKVLLTKVLIGLRTMQKRASLFFCLVRCCCRCSFSSSMRTKENPAGCQQWWLWATGKSGKGTTSAQTTCVFTSKPKQTSTSGRPHTFFVRRPYEIVDFIIKHATKRPEEKRRSMASHGRWQAEIDRVKEMKTCEVLFCLSLFFFKWERWLLGCLIACWLLVALDMGVWKLSEFPHRRFFIFLFPHFLSCPILRPGTDTRPLYQRWWTTTTRRNEWRTIDDIEMSERLITWFACCWVRTSVKKESRQVLDNGCLVHTPSWFFFSGTISRHEIKKMHRLWSENKRLVLFQSTGRWSTRHQRC